MTIVRFGDVVRDVKVNVDRNNNPYEYYVAGDHMETENLKIQNIGRFATDDVGPAFIRIFKPGQILYGSRRTYLKKVAVADFEGITANTTFVLETRDESILLQKLLPFIMLSDKFTKYSIKHSRGSTNPYILFSDLAKYEFDLPSLEEQIRLVDILWAAENHKQAIKQALSHALILKKSLAKESFINGKKITIGDCVEKIVGGGTPSRAKAEYYIGDIPWATVKDIGETDKEKYSTTEYINQDALTHCASNLIAANCLIIATRISLDRQFINKVPMAINQDLRALYPKENVDVEFLYYWFKAHFNEIYNESDGTTVRGIRNENVKSLEIYLPDRHTQNIIVNKFTIIDDTIINLNKLYTSVSDIQKMIMEMTL